jgi:hypothetical protein
VAVLNGRDQLLGYLSGTDCKALASLMDAGVEASAKVVKVNSSGAHPEIRLDVGVLI